MIDFITKHFLVISSAITCIAFALATTLIGAYLTVFDIGLIFLIDISDVSKVALICLAIFSSFYFFLFSITDNVIEFKIKNKITALHWCSITSGIFLLSICIYNQPSKWQFYASIASIIVSTVGFTHRLILIIETPSALRAALYYNMFFLIIGLTATIGFALGLGVKYNGPEYTIVIKQNDNSINLVVSGKILFLTPKYTVINSGEYFQVFPSGDVIRIVERINAHDIK
jgi:hypothetical protein